jgi:hypothetical protein
MRRRINLPLNLTIILADQKNQIFSCIFAEKSPFEVNARTMNKKEQLHNSRAFIFVRMLRAQSGWLEISGSRQVGSTLTTIQPSDSRRSFGVCNADREICCSSSVFCRPLAPTQERLS